MGEIRLLEVDPDLAAGLRPVDVPVARRAVTARALDLPVGAWDAEGAWLQLAPVGMLVLDGLVARDVSLCDRQCRQLIGPGTPIPDPMPGEGLLPARIEWWVIERSRLAVLGEGWLRALSRWPQLAVALARRHALLAQRLAAHQAISQLPRVEDRLVALFLHLAEHWGRITPGGVVVPLRLTHAELGRLIGARRPTVSLALGTLAGQEVLRRRPDESWVVVPELAQALVPPPSPAPRAATVLARRQPALRSARAVPAAVSVAPLPH